MSPQQVHELRVLVARGAAITRPTPPTVEGAERHLAGVGEAVAGFDVPAVLGGESSRARVYYDPVLGQDGAALAHAVGERIDDDFAAVSAFFAGLAIHDLPCHVILSSGVGGAYHHGCLGTEIYCDTRAGDPEFSRFLFVAELVEVFSATQARGWDCGATNGEGLSRVLATALFPAQIAGFATAPDWLGSSRPNWVDQNENTDADPLSNGCAALFLNWLHAELGYAWERIVAAAAPTLAQTYTNLVGRADAWHRFSVEMDTRFPPGATPNLQTDDPFPP
jgi:hypothetical protein